MNITANLRQRIKVNSVLRVSRILEGSGKINVTLGQEVKPQDVLGTYQHSGGFMSLNLANALGISPAEVEKYLQKKRGEKIYKGELLAIKSGLIGKKSLVSPTDAVIEDVSTISGELLLRFLPKQQMLTSGVYGIVEGVNEHNGEVLIKTIATEIFGLFGSGSERAGILNILGLHGNLVTKDQLKREMKGHIVVGGALVYKDTLKLAVNYGLSGMISGGLNSTDFISIVGSVGSASRLDPANRVGTDVGLSLMVTEGFGPIAIGDDIFREISLHQGKFVFLNGNSGRLILPVPNPDIIMTLKNVVLAPSIRMPEQEAEVLIQDIKLGQIARIVWPPFVGSQGEIIDIDKSPTTLPSGVSTYLLTINTPVKKLKVPYTNIELLK